MTKHLRLGLALAAALVFPARAFAQADVVEYYHLDALGNVMAVSNALGTEIESHDYLPFGEEWCGGVGGAVCGSVKAGQPKRFTGKERDAETGLDYFGARYYRANVGRFTTIDPLFTWRENLVDPQRWNRYAYVRNNPLRHVDPDGRAIETPWDAANVAIGIASLGGNIAAGNVGGAILDVAGLVYDGAATVVPGLPGGAGTAIKAVRAADKAVEAKTFIAYTIRGADDQVRYVGRASGQGSAAEVLAKRASAHQHKGAGSFKLEDVQGSRAANRGAEDVIYNRERLRAQAEGRSLLNKANPIGERNRKGGAYVDEYVKEQR